MNIPFEPVEIDSEALIKEIARDLRINGLAMQLLNHPQFADLIRDTCTATMGTEMSIVSSNVERLVEECVRRRIKTMDVDGLIREAIKASVHRRVNELVDIRLAAILNEK